MGFFPLKDRRSLQRQAQPGRYHYKISPQALVTTMMKAFVVRRSGLREIAQREGRQLGTTNFSSLSHAMNRAGSVAFVMGLVGRLASRHRPGSGELVAIDSMAVTLPATQRSRCKKYNDKTVGMGVIWAYAIGAAVGQSPVQVLKTVHGAWHDSAHMVDVALIPRGPVYLMDRGFYAMGLIGQWMRDRVRFIVRGREDSFSRTIRTLSRPRRYGTGRIEFDAWVRLGSSGVAAHPEARMIRATVGAQRLVLVTSEKRWSAERILDAYRKRERIEQFHRWLKDALGLAHLYSFSPLGIEFLLYTALLVALLLFIAYAKTNEETIATLRRALKSTRRRLGLGDTWKRNTFAVKRARRYRQNH